MKKIEVVAAIICKDNKIFATKRGYGEFKDGWEFPGGKMEPGESKEEAIKREIMEELRTEIEVEERLCTVDYDYPEFHLTMHCYLCHVVKGELTLVEHEAAKWLTYETLDSVEWLPADILALDKLKEQLQDGKDENLTRIQQVNFMNMCMITDGEGNVVALDKVNSTYTGTTFPGGHVEAGETFVQAMIREVREETGLILEQVKLRGIYHWFSGKIHNVGFLYEGRDTKQSELKSSDEGPVYWVNLDEFQKKELARGMDKVLAIMMGDEFSECFEADGVEQME